MDPRLISEQYADAVAETLAAVARVPEDERTTPGVSGDWSLKDVMAHLAYWDGVNAREMEFERAGQPIPERDQSVSDANAHAHRISADDSWEEVMSAVRKNSDARREGHKISRRYEYGAGAEHWLEHKEQIDAWLAARGIKETEG